MRIVCINAQKMIRVSFNHFLLFFLSSFPFSLALSVLSPKVVNSNDQFWRYKCPVIPDNNLNIRWKREQSKNFFQPKSSSVVCIHGFGGNADQFRKNVPYLASKGYKPYSMDLLGFGYSGSNSFLNHSAINLIF